MATKDDFDPADWHTVASAPLLAAAIVSAADDGGGNESEDAEIRAFRDALAKLRKKYGKTRLVSDVIDAIEDEGSGAFEALFNALGASASHEHPLEDRVKAVAEAAGILDGVADGKEAKAYKKFVMDAATAVASASKEGFFAFSSRISKNEDFYLRQIQAALRL